MIVALGIPIFLPWLAAAKSTYSGIPFHERLGDKLVILASSAGTLPHPENANKLMRWVRTNRSPLIGRFVHIHKNKALSLPAFFEMLLYAPHNLADIPRHDLIIL